MIPNAGPREVESKGVSASTVFGISLKDSAHIMTILRDTLYSDKVLAVLREYSSNAWDAHRMAGKKDLPIKVILPTQSDPTLTIQDFGTGLSHEDVFQVYTQYGASTKRSSDEAVGMLGIGSKSGFAYSDSFTVTSCHGGRRRTYVALLDESEKGTINLLAEEDCGEDTGVSIQIPVSPHDIYEFTDKAKKLFRYFYPRPDINTDLEDPLSEASRLANGSIVEGDGTWVAVMGCIPYRINLSQLEGPSAPDGGIGNYVHKLSGALTFNIGEVQISASREELKYSTVTKKALIKKFNSLVDEFIKSTISEIDKSGLTIWEKRLRARVLVSMELPIPKDCKTLVQGTVDLKTENAKTFRIHSYRLSGDVTNIPVQKNVRLLMRDDMRSMAGFGLQPFDYVVTPIGTDSLAVVRKELDTLIDTAGLTGLTITNLSLLPWAQPVRNVHGKKVNTKHHVRTFRLIVGKYFGSVKSDCWAIEKRTPTDEDVFVILRGFKSDGFDFYSYYREDEALAKQFGGKMPPIYGYKTTEAKPITPDKCKGIYYPEWRKTFAKSLLTPYVKRLMVCNEWADVIEDAGRRKWRRRKGKSPYEFLKETFGALHPLTLLVKKQNDADKKLEKLGWEKKEALTKLSRLTRDATHRSDASKAMDDLEEKYPLLAAFAFSSAWSEDRGGTRALWIDYVKIMDKVIATGLSESDDKGGTNEQSVLHDHERVDNGSLEGQAVHSEEGRSELLHTEAGAPGGELDPGGEAPDGDVQHPGLVERPVQDFRQYGIVSGYGDAGGHHQENPFYCKRR